MDDYSAFLIGLSPFSLKRQSNYVILLSETLWVTAIQTGTLFNGIELGVQK